MKKIKAKITLLKHQLDFVYSPAQYPALVGGFGSGKTESGINRMLHLMAINGPMFKQHNKTYVYGIYEPTYDLIKTILFGRFEAILSSLNIPYKLNKSDKTLSIPKFNTLIIFRSLENEDKIIGYEHADFWIDELDTLKKRKAKIVFNKIIARNRLNKPNGQLNTGCVTTTPEGFKFVYDTWEKAEDKTKYATVKAKTENNIFLPRSYVEDLRSQYPSNLIEAYLNGEYVNLNGFNVYTNFNREVNLCNLTYTATDTLHIGMDFNVNKMSAVVAIHNEIHNELIVVDEIANVLDTPSMISYIQNNYSNHDIYIYPDSAGKNRSTKDASTSDIKLLQQAGFKVIYNKTNPLIKDRVMSVNSLFRNGNNISRLYINSSCVNLINNLEQQIYDESGKPDKTQGHDHILDALGYLVHKLYPIKRQLFIN